MATQKFKIVTFFENIIVTISRVRKYLCIKPSVVSKVITWEEKPSWRTTGSHSRNAPVTSRCPISFSELEVKDLFWKHI